MNLELYVFTVTRVFINSFTSVTDWYNAVRQKTINDIVDYHKQHRVKLG